MFEERRWVVANYGDLRDINWEVIDRPCLDSDLIYNEVLGSGICLRIYEEKQKERKKKGWLSRWHNVDNLV